MPNCIKKFDAETTQVVYQGSKTDWRSRANIEILIFLHPRKHIYEVHTYNVNLEIYAKPVYIDARLLQKKLPPEEVQEQLKSIKEVHIRRKKSFSESELIAEVNKKVAINYLLSRIANQQDAANHAFSTHLKIFDTDNSKTVVMEEGGKPREVLDIVIPEAEVDANLEKIEVRYEKVPTAKDFNKSLQHLRRQTVLLRNEASCADLALTSIDGFKNAMAEKMRLELELKRSMNPVRLRWAQAINRVLVQNYVEKVKIRLAEVDKIQEARRKEEEAKLTGTPTSNQQRIKKKERNTVDNSLMQLHSTKRDNLLPTIEDGFLPDINISPGGEFKSKRQQRADLRRGNKLLTRKTYGDADRPIKSIEEIMADAEKLPPDLTSSYKISTTKLPSAVSIRVDQTKTLSNARARRATKG